MDHILTEDSTAKLAALWRSGQVLYGDEPLLSDRIYETHTAWVFLAGQRAYKLRKSIDLGFLNYGSLTARQQATRTEIILGQRNSADVYLGEWSLQGEGVHQGRLRSEPSALGASEPIVAMVRLPDELRADRVMSEQSVAVNRLDSMLADCARFHAAAPVDKDLQGWGALERTYRAWSINFEQMPGGDPTVPLSSDERSRLLDQTKEWWLAHAPILEQRVRDGRIREGHGDLRLEHVYLTRPWSVIDPLEFSTALRFCDVAAEIAFLSMEFDAVGRPDAAGYCITSYAALTEDRSLAAVASFFKRYRAVVRAKVEWIRSQQVQGDSRARHLDQARSLIELALAYMP